MFLSLRISACFYCCCVCLGLECGVNWIEFSFILSMQLYGFRFEEHVMPVRNGTMATVSISHRQRQTTFITTIVNGALKKTPAWILSTKRKEGDLVTPKTGRTKGKKARADDQRKLERKPVSCIRHFPEKCFKGEPSLKWLWISCRCRREIQGASWKG